MNKLFILTFPLAGLLLGSLGGSYASPTINSASVTSSSHRHIGPGAKVSDKPVPIFVAHRGDKFLLPEHTLPAYDVAMLENVEYVEPDLVLTSDGHLVCHHDITLKDTTDVGDKLEFRDKMTDSITLELDKKNVTIENDWLISNFTLEELRTLKVNQKSVGVRPQFFNSLFGIPTFEEYIEAVHKDTFRRHEKEQEQAKDHFVMGMIPELKHPDFHNLRFESEHYMEGKFLEVLQSTGYLENDCMHNYTQIPCSPMIVQCFDIDTILYLSENTNLTLLTLLDTSNLRYLTYDGLKELEGKTQYLGVWKELLYTGTQAEVEYEQREYNETEVEALGGFIGPKEFVPYANEMGMKVGIYTIYHSEEDSKRGCAIKCVDDTKEQELQYYFEAGVEMFFVEGVCESLRIRDRYYAKLDNGGTGGAGGRRRGAVGLVLMAVILLLVNSKRFRH